MKKGLLIAALLALGVGASPAFAEDTGAAAGSVNTGAGASKGDALVVGGTAIVAAGIIGGVVAAAADKGHGASSTSTSTSTATSTH